MYIYIRYIGTGFTFRYLMYISLHLSKIQLVKLVGILTIEIQYSCELVDIVHW